MVRPNNNIDNKINIGVELLNESVNLYNDGKFNLAYEKYLKAGQYLNEAKEKSQTNEGKNCMTYGDNLNFGVIYKIFESNAINLLSSKDNQHKLRKIMGLIKENKVLLNQFATYNAFTNPVNVVNTTEYVNEAISLITKYTPQQLKENNQKLINIFKEYELNEDVSLTQKELKIFENIEFLLLNEKNFNNITKFNEIQKQLCEHVESHNKLISESKSLGEIYEENIDKIVNKYQDTLNEDEITFLECLSNPTEAEKLFETSKANTIELIKEEIKQSDNETKIQWNEILEQINNKVFVHSNALKDIYEFIEISNEIEK